MLASPALDDAVWRALADPTRRTILDLLRARPRTTGQLAAAFPEVTRFAVMKHLRALTGAGLVTVARRGRERWNHLNAVPIQRIYGRWLQPFASAQADALLRLAALTEAPLPDEGNPTMDTPLDALDFSMDVRIAAPRERVWAALVEDTGRWWPADYYIGAGGRNFIIEARLGGRMFEDWGEGQGLVWARVVGVRTGEMLQLVGDSGPEFGGPSRGFHRFDLKDDGEGTLLTFRESAYGVLSKETASSLEEGWRFLFADCLKPFVETGAQPARPDTVEV